MELLKKKIREEGKALTAEILKVDGFLNHQIDVNLLEKIGEEFYQKFQGEKITKVITIEASGIGVACMTAKNFKVPVIFAKKTDARNQDASVYESEVYSYTRQKSYTIKISKDYLNENDTVLIIDDFLANGAAVRGLTDIIKQSGAKLVGVGIVIEKGFQPGGKNLRASGLRVESLAIVKSMSEGEINFE